MARESARVVSAVLILFIAVGLLPVFLGNVELTVQAFVYSFIAVMLHVFSKKIVARRFDADVEHSIWSVYRFGFKTKQHFKKEVPFGLILPLAVSLFSVLFLLPFGLWLYFFGILTYETRALKRRAAKRHGYYSYTEMSDWHNGLIGAAGILSLLILSAIVYFLGLEFFTKILVYYAFWNMLPISNLDGTQIFFGNRILYWVLAVITLIFTIFALII